MITKSKPGKTTVRVATAAAGMAVFLGAATAAGIDRGKDMSATGFTVNADAAATVLDWTPIRVQ